MTHSLSDFLDLTPADACSQWKRIGLRSWPLRGKRQEPFLPLEVLLCYGLFFLVNPHSFGGGNIDKVPQQVTELAGAFKRSAGSILSKMLNLDGSRKNCAAFEPELFGVLAAHPDQFASLYFRIIAAGVQQLGEDAVPHFLYSHRTDHYHLLLGQDELGEHELGLALVEAEDNRRMLEVEKGLDEISTVRIIQQRARLGQHRFARDVLRNYDYTCAFCGFSPKHMPGHKLLLASHVKPWRDSNNKERLDPRNGIAACPLHDSAFDTGLITVNGGLRIHRSATLIQSVNKDVRANDYFGDAAISQTLQIPQPALAPKSHYLKWHKDRIFQGP